MKKPKFSVIVPIYNSEKYIEECIQSALAQGGDDAELILVNDGSTDRSGEIIENALSGDGRIRVIHCENAGHIAARMTGVGAAEGEYILFLDSDDTWHPDLLSTVTDCLDKWKSDFLVFMLEKGGAPCRNFFGRQRDNIPLEEYFKVSLANSGLNSLPIKVIKKSLFDAVKYDDLADFKNSEDLLLSIRLVKKAKRISYLPKVLYTYRQTPGSITNSLNLNMMKEYELSRLELWNEMERLGVADEEGRQTLLSGYLRRAADFLSSVSRSDLDKGKKKEICRSIADAELFGEAMSAGAEKDLEISKRIRLRMLSGGMFNAVLSAYSLREAVR